MPTKTKNPPRDETIYVVDLFCGAGGTSTGLLEAAEEIGLNVDLLAVNHWTTAIETHRKNHPNVRHLCESVETVDPREQFPGGRLHLLIASPECRNHSNARGGKPMCPQNRATAWHVLRWAADLYVDHVLIENVREFRDWGPLDKLGRPVKSRKGEYYRAFLRHLRAMGYRVEDRLLNAADFGAATTRTRLFIQAHRPRKPIRWPEPTHLRPGEDTLGIIEGARRWRPAKEIIDWSIPSQSIFTRKKPLAPNTMARIAAGLRKFCGLPFLVDPAYAGANGGYVYSTERPAPTVTTRTDLGLVQPFLVILRNNADARSVDDPVPALTTGGNVGLAQPFLVVFRNRQDAMSVELPVPTLTTKGANLGLCEPFLTEYHGNHNGRSDAATRIRSTDEPLPAQDTSNRFALVQPFLVQLAHNGSGHNGHAHRCYPADRPLPTVEGKGMFGLVEPFVIGQQSGAVARSVEDPLPTVATSGAIGLVTPFIAEYHGDRDGEERVRSVDEPLPTVTTARNIFGLVQPFLIGAGGPQGAGQPRSVDEPLGTVLTESRRALVQPYIIPTNHGQDERSHSVESPLPAVTTFDAWALIEPFLVQYNGTAEAHSLEEPLPTQATRDRFALVLPELAEGDRLALLDIRFRMLQPHELAAAMGFPSWYFFAGNREQKVKQIGNAVERRQARALAREILAPYARRAA